MSSGLLIVSKSPENNHLTSHKVEGDYTQPQMVAKPTSPNRDKFSLKFHSLANKNALPGRQRIILYSIVVTGYFYCS
jgi:hypothetical protein